MIRGVPRLNFFEMPASVIAAVARAVGAEARAYGAAGLGFSPGPAGRLDLTDGRVVFVKACSDDLNSFASEMHRREARILGLLPAAHPSPSLLATVELDGWVVLVTDYHYGTTPSAPISAKEAAEALGLLTVLAEAGTPCPTDGLSPFPGSADHTDPMAWRFWTPMLGDDKAPVGLDPWSRRHLADLADLETTVLDAVAGESLVHGDLRPDNMVLWPDNTVLWPGGGVAVDWPGATVGAPWVDLVGLLPALQMLGGPTPVEVFDNHPLGVAADRGKVDVFLSSLTGYFTSQALLPPIPGVPGLREFQAAQGAVCRTWLAQRLGWDQPGPTSGGFPVRP